MKPEPGRPGRRPELTKPQLIAAHLPGFLVRRIDAFAKRYRLVTTGGRKGGGKPNRSAALRELVKLGLNVDGEKRRRAK